MPILLFVVVVAAVRPSLAQPAPRGPTDLEVENLEALARLYGAVRFFHPSDEAAAADWDRLAVLGAQRAAGAPTPAALADSLRSVFGPVAPTVEVAAGDLPTPSTWPDGDDTVAWQHLGVRLDDRPSIYRSVRLGREAPPDPVEAAPFGVVVRRVDAAELRGRRVRLSAAVRAERGVGRLWLRVDREGGEMGFFDNMEDRPVTSPLWARYVIEGPVADDALEVALGGLVPGDGAAAFDAFRLEVEGDDGWAEVPLANGSFDAGLDGWFAESPGYTSPLVDAADGRALRIAFVAEGALAEPLFEERSEIGDAAVLELGLGLTARVPLALPSLGGQTLPLADPDALDALRRVLAGLDPAEPGPASRAADVVVAWSVFEHFYPYFDVVEVDWDAALRDALRDALAAESSCVPLRRLVARLQDGHGRVSCADEPDRRHPAFAVERVEGRPVVVATADAARFRLGDVVVALDGAPAGAVLDSLAALASGSPHWRAHRAASEFGAGPDGSVARVVLERDGRRLEVDASRALRSAPKPVRPDPIAEVRPGIVYVDLDRTTDEEVQERLHEIVSADGLVVDVRGYPRVTVGLLTVLTDRPVTSTLWEIPTSTRPGRGVAAYDTTRWAPLSPAAETVRGPVAVLMGAGSISYAESWLGVVDHYGLGTTVGGPTAGANGNVSPFRVPGRHRLSWTGMRVRRHDGRTLHGVGIEPDVPVAPTVEGVRAGRDEVLERALEVVTGER